MKEKNEVDIMEVLTAIQHQLNSLERKVDALANKPERPSFDRSNRSDRGDRGDRGRRNDYNREKPQMHQVTCADCGVDCEVPFVPTGNRPVYCSECFSSHKPEGDQKSSFKSFGSQGKFQSRDEGKRSNFRGEKGGGFKKKFGFKKKKQDY